MTHGLSGQGVVNPEGVDERIARRVAEFTADLRPRTAAGSALIDHLAICSVRMDRAAEHDTAATAYRVRHAFDRFDEERIEAANALFEKLADDPRATLRGLRKSPEGIEKLLDAWEDLRNDLTVGVWGVEPLERAVNLSGLKGRHASGTMLGALSRALEGDFEALGDDEGAGLDLDDRKAWAKIRLFEMIDAEIAGLEAHHQTLDFETIDLDRAEAPGRALFDASKPACLARRYESEASRGFYRALREFRKVEAEFAAQPRSAPAPAQPTSPPPAPTRPETASRMGSFREMPPKPKPELTPVHKNPVHAEVATVREVESRPSRPHSTAVGAV